MTMAILRIVYRADGSTSVCGSIFENVTIFHLWDNCEFYSEGHTLIFLFILCSHFLTQAKKIIKNKKSGLMFYRALSLSLLTPLVSPPTDLLDADLLTFDNLMKTVSFRSIPSCLSCAASY